MEKTYSHVHELDWVDGLLAVLESARKLLLALKRSHSVGRVWTLEEFARENGLDADKAPDAVRGRKLPLTDKSTCCIPHAIHERHRQPLRIP